MPRNLRFALPWIVAAVASACSASPEDASYTASAENAGDFAADVASATEQGDVKDAKGNVVPFLAAPATAFEKGRPGRVNYIVIHDVEGTAHYGLTLLFKEASQASAHFLVDRTGLAIQMVREEDIANHAGQAAYNAYGIGIEHEGHAGASEYTEAEYAASAWLVATLAKKYQLPIDRKHIVGHSQVPDVDTAVAPCAADATTCGGKSHHSDPGAHWDWTKYMALVKKAAAKLGYAGPNKSALAEHGLTPVTPVRTFTLSKGLPGGYWATQCAGPDRQIAYRIMVKDKNGGDRLESRYTQPRIGACGEKTNGVYPLVFHGPEASFDLASVTAEVCTAGRKDVYGFDNVHVTASMADGKAYDAPVMSLVSSSQGC